MSATRVVIELEDGSGPIAGWIRGDEAGPKFFSGYMELIAALEAARLKPPPASLPDPPAKLDP